MGEAAKIVFFTYLRVNLKFIIHHKHRHSSQKKTLLQKPEGLHKNKIGAPLILALVWYQQCFLAGRKPSVV